MTINLPKLKELAQAAQHNQYDPVALNDYSMAVPPATVLELIDEIERHRQVNAEGCKPDSNILLAALPCAGTSPIRSLDKAGGSKPDLESPIDPGVMPPIPHRLVSVSCELLQQAIDAAAAVGMQDTADQLDRILTPTTAKSAEPTDVLPTAALEGDQLVIRITTDCLLHAVTCAPEWPVDYTGATIIIHNGTLLIQEIINELQREDEKGANQMHRLLDQAALGAINNGSEAVSYD